MQKFDRRQLLKTAAAVTAGAAVGAIGMPPLTAAAAGGGISHPNGAQQALPKLLTPNTPLTPNTTYSTLSGSDFKPSESADGYVQNDQLYIYPATATSGDFRARFPVPNGAVITEAVFWVVNNDASGMNFFAPYRFMFDGTFQTYGFAAQTAASPNLVAVTVPVTPVTVDNTANSYWAVVTFGVTTGAQQLYAARLGWLLEPGLTTFANPRRIYGDGTLLSPGQPVLHVDATKKTDGTPSGVPAGATAAFCAVSSYGTGAISLYKDGDLDNGIGAWASQGTAGNGVNQGYNLVPLSAAGKFSFTNYFTSKAMYFDVWGYLV